MCFIEKEEKLEINNIDLGTLYEKKSRHDSLFPHTMRVLIINPYGCGKTNLIFTLLIHSNEIKFESIYIYSKNLHQPEYIMLEKVLNGVNLFKVIR